MSNRAKKNRSTNRKWREPVGIDFIERPPIGYLKSVSNFFRRALSPQSCRIDFSRLTYRYIEVETKNEGKYTMFQNYYYTLLLSANSLKFKPDFFPDCRSECENIFFSNFFFLFTLNIYRD